MLNIVVAAPGWHGKIQAYATNRDNELINGDWAVHKVMKGSPLASEVSQLMATGGLDPVVKRSGNTAPGCALRANTAEGGYRHHGVRRIWATRAAGCRSSPRPSER